MWYDDRVYGSVEILDPVIVDLIASPFLQRLRFIDQGGFKPLWARSGVDIREGDHSRFAHSMGVYLLLRQYGATIQEQIAGLIHDVSHSAFSHCIDYVLDSGSEETHSLQDDRFHSFVLNSDIPDILQKHDFDLEYILDDVHFPLKEKELPDLCADRLDYSLRTALLFGYATRTEIDCLLSHLVVSHDQWIFADFVSAQKYTYLFATLNREQFAGLSSAVMFRSVGDYLKHALQKGYISEQTLFTKDNEVLSQIAPYHGQDKQLGYLWDCMNKRVPLSQGQSDTSQKVFCKSRAVDPLFLSSGEIKRVSDLDLEWRSRLLMERRPKVHSFSFSS